MESIEAAATRATRTRTAQSAKLDSKLDAARQAATELQRRIVEQFAQCSAKGDADAH
jgi:hypothetical protein